MEVYYSGGRLGQAVHSFCKAAGDNFFVTVDGDVSSCLEVTDSKNPRAGTFVYGKIGDGVEISKEKLTQLRARVVENLPYCNDCFAKYSCAGDCLAKVHAQSGDMFDTSSNRRCEINRGALLYSIENKLKGGKNGE